MHVIFGLTYQFVTLDLKFEEFPNLKVFGYTYLIFIYLYSKVLVSILFIPLWLKHQKKIESVSAILMTQGILDPVVNLELSSMYLAS